MKRIFTLTAAILLITGYTAKAQSRQTKDHEEKTRTEVTLETTEGNIRIALYNETPRQFPETCRQPLLRQSALPPRDTQFHDSGRRPCKPSCPSRSGAW